MHTYFFKDQGKVLPLIHLNFIILSKECKTLLSEKYYFIFAGKLNEGLFL